MTSQIADIRANGKAAMSKRDAKREMTILSLPESERLGSHEPL